MSHLPQQQKIESIPTHSSTSPHDHNIDPAIAGSGMMSASAGDSGGDDNGATSDGRKNGKRELSTSKRAAQNRAAQVCSSNFFFFFFFWKKILGNAGDGDLFGQTRMVGSSLLTKSLRDPILCHHPQRDKANTESP